MESITRRHFTGLMGLGVIAGLTKAPALLGAAKPRVVIVGGGAGGASAARAIAMASAGAIDVTLVEASKLYSTCFFSNLYLGGLKDYASIGHNYENLSNKHGVNLVHDWATQVDGAAKTVTLASGGKLSYDKLILSPGIDIKYDSIPGYSVEAQNRMPHAWKSGTQVQALRHQVLNMKQGGTFVMVPPPNPYRCPPGPYERVSAIAHQFKQTNPTAKIIVLDPKAKFSKQGLFMQGWENHYPDMIEWISTEVHGGITSVDAEKMVIETDLDTFTADAACVVPAQKSGSITVNAGVNDGDWAPIKPASMQSAADDNIYVLGDASVASAMPKSAFSANSQAKVAANSIIAALTGKEAPEATYANTCWSFISTDNGVKVGANYKAGADKIESTSSFVSQTDEDENTRKNTFAESHAWYAGITADMFS